MKATGIVVEYNPFHNGHLYHVDQSRKATGADCVIAVMSGQFLQRGEPAIIDKFFRTKMALANGIDILVELPYPFAVQSSHYFAMGAIDTLANLFVDSIVFGSESGDIAPFYQYVNERTSQKDFYNKLVKKALDLGKSYPEANDFAFKHLNIGTQLDLSLPNNILGRSYVERIVTNHPHIEALTIQRKDNQYHDETINSHIASATSIRKELFNNDQPDKKVTNSLPQESILLLNKYYQKAGQWHHLESYFHYLRFCVLRMDLSELKEIHGVDEGLEYKLKETVQQAQSMKEWLLLMKSKRYTWTRLQRMFIHILTNTKKSEINNIHRTGVQSIRLLGMSQVGRSYLNQYKKQLSIPIIGSIQQFSDDLLTIEERVSHSYYSILNPAIQRSLFKAELKGPILVS